MDSTSASQFPALKFAPLQSRFDVQFWSELAERKLDRYRLSEEPVPLHGTFSCSRYVEVGSQLCLDGGSFELDHPCSSNSTSSAQAGQHLVKGTGRLYNTWESFRDSDKAEILKEAAARVWKDILSGETESTPELLSQFTVLCYADLKLFHFHYWFGLPALKPPSPFLTSPSQSVEEYFGTDASKKVAEACDAWLRQSPGHQLVEQPAQGGESTSVCEVDASQLSRTDVNTRHASPPAWMLSYCISQEDTTLPQESCTGLPGIMVRLACQPLAALNQLSANSDGSTVSDEQWMLAFSDHSSVSGHPGWVLRNLLLMIAVRYPLVKSLKVVCVRASKTGRVDPSRCLVLTVQLPAVPDGWCQGPGEVPEAVGWEPNAEGRLLPRKVDLSPVMSPTLLAEQAVGLNLRLMRWRAAPDLEFSHIANCKCLILGAGTLGCSVSRCLLAWGVHKITLVDSARVSYSNPVRQWLYELKDCTAGGKPKAAAAAEALLRIFPSVNVEGKNISIPMPGHAPANDAHEQSMHEAYDSLDQLVSEHDAVFLLTDTRESRWLPSLLSAVHGKITITAAVGFDSYVVMRHGTSPLDSARTEGLNSTHESGSGAPSSQAQLRRLGCYFCNDVVGPVNSTHNRTLDQQCTVARPGLAPITSALAVELLAALLQHPAGIAAPAQGSTPARTAAASADAAGLQGAAACEEEPALGAVPHMIRGQLNGFSQTCMVGLASSQCTACSKPVVDLCQKHGWSFVLQALKDPHSLEESSGLADLHREYEHTCEKGETTWLGEDECSGGSCDEELDI